MRFMLVWVRFLVGRSDFLNFKIRKAELLFRFFFIFAYDNRLK